MCILCQLLLVILLLVVTVLLFLLFKLLFCQLYNSFLHHFREPFMGWHKAFLTAPWCQSWRASFWTACIRSPWTDQSRKRTKNSYGGTGPFQKTTFLTVENTRRRITVVLGKIMNNGGDCDKQLASIHL